MDTSKEEIQARGGILETRHTVNDNNTLTIYTIL